jgi:hypothetical protein
MWLMSALVWAAAVARGAESGPFVEGRVSAEQLPATPVTVAVKDAAVREAFRQLHEQTGMLFTMWDETIPGQIAGRAVPQQVPEDERKVTMDARRAPLWEALQRLVAPEGGAMAWSMGEPHQDTVTRYAGRAQVVGPFLLLATEVRREVDFRYPAATAEDFVLTLRIIEDPAVHIIALPSAIVPARAMDENGKSLVPTRAISPFSNGAPSPRQATVAVALHRPAGAGQRIAKLEAKLEIDVVAKTETFEMQISQTINKKCGDIQASFAAQYGPVRGVMLRSAGSGTDVVSLEAAFVRPDEMGDEQWAAWSNLFATTEYGMNVYDADGKPWEWENFARRPDASRKVVTLQASRGVGDNRRGSAAKAVVQVPVQAAHVTIPFHFEDLPLP